ncbi:MAG: (d)CMP kinase [Holosporaceae bacterium]|jgi:3-phosphoshikimate 1-carboxyvinyltransferase/cytidylate kinase|nr:(d)CMP kinase [Holosporaceae bacterium]
MKPVVAIDGYAGSGKGTMALMLAQHLGFAHLDSGLLYRMAAYVQLNLVQEFTPEALGNVLAKMSLVDLLEMKQQVSENILRTEAISLATTSISALPVVRNIITKFIREFAANPGESYGGSVIDGRDIASVVIPDAACKIFMTAEPQIRAKRRFEALKVKNCSVTFEDVYKNMMARDQHDSSRNADPLTFNDDYIIVDTSNETVEESFEKIVKIINDSVINK